MRLIDADKFLEKMQGTYRYFAVKFDIEEAPTVDAVTVVRCKDCIYHEDNPDNADFGWFPPDKQDCWCNYWDNITNKQGFCSYGEKIKKLI